MERAGQYNHGLLAYLQICVRGMLYLTHLVDSFVYSEFENHSLMGPFYFENADRKDCQGQNYTIMADLLTHRT